MVITVIKGHPGMMSHGDDLMDPHILFHKSLVLDSQYANHAVILFGYEFTTKIRVMEGRQVNTHIPMKYGETDSIQL